MGGVGGWVGGLRWAASKVYGLVPTALLVADGDALAAARAGTGGEWSLSFVRSSESEEVMIGDWFAVCRRTCMRCARM